MIEEVYVIWWRAKDGSAAGVARVHSDKERADQERDLLEVMSDGREFEISEQPIYDPLAKPEAA